MQGTSSGTSRRDSGAGRRDRKALGAFYTPPEVIRVLVAWATRGASTGDVLDPACGDGRFLSGLPNAVGVDIDPAAASMAAQRTTAEIVNADFFDWARSAERRFDAVVGNPPFIRYQRFRGAARRRALEYCSAQGVKLSGLCSSWAPFVVAAASVLRPGGRLAFVVPAEIGHSVYARPVVHYLLGAFRRVEVAAVRKKLFPDIAEDCWLLTASGFSGRASALNFAALDSIDELNGSEAQTGGRHGALARRSETVPVAELEQWGFRLRPFILPRAVRSIYLRMAASAEVHRLGAVARIGIGYVTGANGFFHLRPSMAEALGIPDHLVRISVRFNRDLPSDEVDQDLVDSWIARDRPVLLLDLAGQPDIPPQVQRYLSSAAGEAAREAYKCRHRRPWFAVPDVRVPHAFLSIMSGRAPKLIGNPARATCTNSVHAVDFRTEEDASGYLAAWSSELTALSCEVEGHALGGGVLKLEPSEARAVLVAKAVRLTQEERAVVKSGIGEMRRWRNADAA